MAVKLLTCFCCLVSLVCPASAASISGVILPPGRAKGVRAFEREGTELFKIKNRYHKGTIDPETGKFTIPKLPDGTYQLLIDCGDAEIEGVDLHIDDEEEAPVFDYLFKPQKLTVKRLDLSEFFDPDEVVSDERRRKIVGRLVGLPKLVEKFDSIGKVDRFCEHLRPLYAHGTRKRAFVLVEKARLRSFYAGRGQAIYRVEIWSFRRYGAVWEKVRAGVRVLRRYRFRDKAALQRLGVFFEPALGGIKILKQKDVQDIRYTIPDKWHDALGKVPGRPVRTTKPPAGKSE
jgi:hypothetical protein